MSLRLSADPLEERAVPAVVDLAPAEQYYLELLNRARANPAAEAARYGIDLNEGLAAGTISTAAAPPLAPDNHLSASIHSQLQYLTGLGTLTHTGAGGTSVGQRVTAAGYPWSSVGENLAVTSGFSPDARGADELHRLLFVDANYPGRGHRVNLLRGNYEEVGVGLAAGPFQGAAGAYAGQDFGARTGNALLTGVAFTDAVLRDQFYTVGEGIGGVAVTAAGPAGTFRTTTGAAGGYALELPAGTYSVTFLVPGGASGTRTVTIGATNVKADFVPGGATSPPAGGVSPPPTSPPPSTTNPPASATLPFAAVPPRAIVVGADAGGAATIRLLDPATGRAVTEVPSPATFGTGARVAAADFNGDGAPDIVAATGPGSATEVRVIDGKSHEDLFVLHPFEAGFRGGVYVAAGDVSGDGKPDLIVTPDEGGGPRVRVFNGNGFGQLADFWGIDDPNFRGGVRPAVGDVNGDRVGDVIVAAGFMGGPRVAAFSGKSVGSGQPAKLFGDFFAFEQGLRNGIFVAVGDVNGDGYADLVAGGGPGGGPRVKVFSGKALAGNQQAALADFFGGDANGRGGVRVTVEDLDADGKADVILGSGPTGAGGGGSRVTAYAGKSLSGGNPPTLFTVDAFPGFDGGVYVG